MQNLEIKITPKLSEDKEQAFLANETGHIWEELHRLRTSIDASTHEGRAKLCAIRDGLKNIAQMYDNKLNDKEPTFGLN